MVAGRWRLLTMPATPDLERPYARFLGLEAATIRPELLALTSFLTAPFAYEDLARGARQSGAVREEELGAFFFALLECGALANAELSAPRSETPFPWRWLNQPGVYAAAFGLLVLLTTIQSTKLWLLRHRIVPMVGTDTLLLGLFFVLCLPWFREAFRRAVSTGSLERKGIGLRWKGLIPVMEQDVSSVAVPRERRWIPLSAGLFFDLFALNAFSFLLPNFDRGVTRAAYAGLSASLVLLVCSWNPLAKYDGFRFLNALFGTSDIHALARAHFRARRISFLSLLHLMRMVYSVCVIGGIVFLLDRVLFTLAIVSPTIRLGAEALLAATLLWRIVLRSQRPVLPANAPASKGLTFEATTVAVAHREVRATLWGFLSAYDARSFSAAQVAPQMTLWEVGGDAGHGIAESFPALARELFRSSWTQLTDDERFVLRAVETAYAQGLVDPRSAFVPGLDLYEGSNEFGMLDNSYRFNDFPLTRLMRCLSAPHLPANRQKCASALGGFLHPETRQLQALLFRKGSGQRALAMDSLSPSDVTPTSEAIAAALDTLVERTTAFEYHALAAHREVPRAFLREHRLIPILHPSALTDLPPAAIEALSALGLFGADGVRISRPSLLIPVGPKDAPTGVKSRTLWSSTTFGEGSFSAVGQKRYRRYLLPKQRRLLAEASPTFDMLPAWSAVPAQASELFLFEGEMKAMAFHSLFGRPVAATGGLLFDALDCLVRSLLQRPDIQRVYICFDADVMSPRVLRIDGMSDAEARSLFLAERLQRIAKKEVFLVRGLRRDGEKLDLDAVLGLSASHRKEAIAEFQTSISTAKAAVAIWQDESLTGYIRSWNDFSDEFYRLFARRYELEANARTSDKDWSDWLLAIEQMHRRAAVARALFSTPSRVALAS